MASDRPAGTSVGEALGWAARQFAPLHDTARLDAEVLLAHLLARSRAWLYAHPEQPLSADTEAAYAALVARRQAGEPIAYLTGTREFWSLALTVTPDTLIPRPETELAVETALALLPEHADQTVVDAGTGSGAIALAIAHERPRARVLALDRSAAALAVAQANARRLGLANVQCRRGHWLDPLGGERAGLIVSNPPYVADGDEHLDRGDVRFEPREALAAGPDGLAALRHLIGQATCHLAAGGWLVLEHGCDQGAAVRDLLARRGYRDIASRRDAPGHERVTFARAPAESG